jgi:diadenosine tetraphosphate (Ap4A) HIT family hydrolase
VSECAFCAIVRGELERSVVCEDEVLLLIVDLHPVNDGHALVLHVIPRFAGDPFRVHREGGPAEGAQRAELDAGAARLREAW